MLKTMEELIRAQALIAPGSHVLCAVSGGADSICLLHALCRLRERLDFTLSAAHYDHRLRGEESRRDAAFVEQFVALCCGEQRTAAGKRLPAVRLYSGAGDVAARARERGRGIEETAREMRYAFLRQAAREAGADRIATAHTANDNAETVLLHLARGSGLRGLGGIPPRRGELIRPLLTTTRRQVEEYLAYYAMPFMEDSSNGDERFARNRVRRRVMPVLEEIAPGFPGRLAASAALLRADEEFLTQLARQVAAQAVPREGGLAIPAGELARAPEPVAARAVRLLLGRLWGGEENCASVHLLSVLALCRGEDPSAQVHLPNGSVARRCYGQLLLTAGQGPAALEPGRLPMPGRMEAGPWVLSCRREVYQGQPQGPWEFWLDGALESLLVRPRCTGDRLALPGRPAKSVKKWMIEARLPRFQRECLPVFEGERGLAAAAGLGPDEGCLSQRGRPAWHISILPRPEDGPGAP